MTGNAGALARIASAGRSNVKFTRYSRSALNAGEGARVPSANETGV